MVTAVKVSIFSASSSELVSEAGLGVDKTDGLVLFRFYFGVLARSSVFSSKGKSCTEATDCGVSLDTVLHLIQVQLRILDPLLLSA